MNLLKKYEIFLFDLDGTLLDLDFNSFVSAYYGLLFERASRYMDPLLFKKALQAGIEAMKLNDGSKTNKEAFYEAFEHIAGPIDRRLQAFFDEFYQNDFKKLSSYGRLREEAIRLVSRVRQAKKKIVLATNPIFPEVAVIERLKWAGLGPELFDLITSFERMRACKPAPIYFKQIMEMIRADGLPAIMVGDDPILDTGALEAGIDVLLLDPEGKVKPDPGRPVITVSSLAEIEKML